MCKGRELIASITSQKGSRNRSWESFQGVSRGLGRSWASYICFRWPSWPPHVGPQNRPKSMKRWINESMQRCWNSVPDSERVITENSVTRLFANLVAPFGEDHPFSCIPNVFFPNGRRPAKTYIRQATRQMFDAWAREQNAPSSKRRKRGGGGAAAGDEQGSEGREVQAPPERVSADRDEREPFAHEGSVDRQDPPSEGEEMEDSLAEEDGGDAGGEGHPDCTSVEDCIGVPHDRLIEHVMQGAAGDTVGDVYCESCWASFLDQNPKLEGVYQDTREPFA
jgi:hypothetical protein